MRNLISFLIKHSVWILTVFYVIVSAVLLFRFNAYQQSVFFSSANQVSGWVYSLSGNITGYFGLRQINRDLQERNGFLEMEVARLKRVLESDDYKTLAEYASKDTALSRYNFQVAQVINNSVMRPANYITINKGSDDGIRTEMGVIDRNGVVGKVDIVGKNFSRVISLLNPKWRLSCKVKYSDYFGSLVWDGQDARYAVLEELPRPVDFAIGDTIITSGFSSVFPEGIFVGTIKEYSKQKNDNFYALKIELSTDFYRLNDVLVIDCPGQEERKEIEERN